jgi:hypothetical protein
VRARARARRQEADVIPIVASALIGLAGKVGVGILAGIAKRVLEAARTDASPPAETFSGQLAAQSVFEARPGEGNAPTELVLPDDLAARVAAERLQFQALGTRPRLP